MHVNVRSMGVGRVGVCMVCVCDSEERERGVGTGVNAIMLSETLKVVGIAEAATRAFQTPSRLRGEISYEQQIKRELKRIYISGCRCNERLKAKTNVTLEL